MTFLARRIALPLALTWLLGVNPAFAAVAVHLQGRVPPAINAPFVAGEFSRIWNAVAPGEPLDSGAITIIYYSRRDEKLLGVRLPEWGGGGAIGKDTIIVPVDRASLADMDVNRITVHELVHTALERAYGRLRLPRWLHEGLAMTLSGELSFEEQTVLSRAILTKSLLPLDSIEHVNRFDAYGAALAYSQSHLTVVMLIDSYGIDGIPELLAAVRSSGRFDTALLQVFGFGTDELERLARNYITGKYRWVLFIGDTYLFWVPAALLVIVGFFSVKIRNRKKTRLMEEEESRSGNGDNEENDDDDEEWEEGEPPGEDDGDDAAVRREG